tara:strand:+ start:260 stop:436 length:177 start_codon:yes stop_codon:yes gene_type:complete
MNLIFSLLLAALLGVLVMFVATVVMLRYPRQIDKAYDTYFTWVELNFTKSPEDNKDNK